MVPQPTGRMSGTSAPAGPGRPAAAGHAGVVRPAARYRWWRELLLAGGFYLLYDGIRGMISGSTAQAQRDGQKILHLEQLLHIEPEHFLNNAFGHAAVLAVPACYFYATLHFLLTPAVLIWAYRRRPATYRRARSTLALITLGALAGFWRFPTAPPRLLAQAGFQDTLAHFSSWGWWATDASVPAAAAAIANQYAAMPSLHLAWAAWSGAIAYQFATRRSVRLLAVSYPVLTALVVLGTANHYLLDVLAGVALWAFATGLVGYLSSLGLLPRGTAADSPAGDRQAETLDTASLLPGADDRPV